MRACVHTHTRTNYQVNESTLKFLDWLADAEREAVAASLFDVMPKVCIGCSKKVSFVSLGKFQTHAVGIPRNTCYGRGNATSQELLFHFGQGTA